MAFILTAVNPCCFRSAAASRTALGWSPPTQPYTRRRSRTLPPNNCQMGTPSFLPLISHNAMSSPESADYRFDASVVGGALWREISAHHQDWTTAVEARSVGRLPNVLDAICVPVHKTGSKVTQGAFDCFGVSFEGGFAPSDEPLCGFDTHEKPSRRDAEELEGESVYVRTAALRRCGDEHAPRFLRSGLPWRW